MCLIAIAINQHPDLPVIIAANRDEFYDRPTAPLAFWEPDDTLLAGRDLKEGGTWLGVTRTGRIAAVTNFRAPVRPDEYCMTGMISRGELVCDFLTGPDRPDTFLDRLRQNKDRYNGFNLIFGGPDRILWYANTADRHETLTPGIHIISNHLLNTPWPKAEKVRTDMARLLENQATIDPDAIFAMLADRQRPADDRLPDTGVGQKWERILSPVFVTSEIYGTRSSSVILVHKNHTLTFMERTYAVPVSATEPPEYKTRQFEVRLRTK